MKLGEWIEQEKSNQGLTTYALAKQSGLTHDHLTKIIKGEVVPRADTLEKIQQALGARYPGDIEEDGPTLMTSEKAEEYRAKDIEVILAGNPALSPADIEAIMLIVEGKERQLREAEERPKKGKGKKE